MTNGHELRTIFNGTPSRVRSSVAVKRLHIRGGGQIMSLHIQALRRASVVITGLSLILVLLAWATSVHARVTRIVIDTDTTSALDGARILAGRAWGELNPHKRVNEIIQDIELGRDPDGMVRYVTSFQLVIPATPRSGLMWHDVPNRGGRITIPVASRAEGDIGLSSGWQGDNSGSSPTG